MEFQLLGPVQVVAGGTPVAISRRSERHLLALLLLDAGRPVSTERLIEELWGARPPRTPRETLQVYASRLRGQLTATGVDTDLVRVVKQADGYAVHCDPAAVDLHRFAGLVDRGQRALRAGRAREAAGLLAEALALWRGPALADVPASPAVQATVTELTEQRATATEARIDADLACGRHADVILELQALIKERPLREPLYRQLMIAQYRSGRQGDALATYRQARERLATELGVDPRPDLRQVELAILRHDPSLEAGALEPPEDPACVAPAPAQLPPDLSTFTGRADELTTLLSLAEEHADQPRQAVVISAIDGMAGIGKTTLAVHAAHRLAERYPDGQLFVDLHGHTQGMAPTDPTVVLDQILRALGVPGSQIPHELDARAALYRTRLADRSMLILLDNAFDEEQVRPLLPASPRCLVLITSRRVLGGLEHARPVALDVLRPLDAVALFATTAELDRPVGESRELITEIVRLCGRLPLAIRLAAARFRHRPAWTLEYLAERLRGQDGLSEFEFGRSAVASAIDASYRQLDPAQQRMFRLLGLHPGADIEACAAAALGATTADQAGRLLEDLVDMNLVEQHLPGRFRLHDLVRAHAVSLVGGEPEPWRRDAVTRLLDHYAATARAAARLRYSTPDAPEPGAPRDSRQAATWLDAELANLVATASYAANHGRPDHVARMSAMLHDHLRARASYVDAETLHTQAVRAARDVEDRVGELHALNRLAEAHHLMVKHESTVRTSTQALELARRLNARDGELTALHGLGRAHRMLGHYRQAADYFEQALSIAHEIGDRAGERDGLRGLAAVHRLMRRHDQAAEYLQRVLDLAREDRDHRSELLAMIGLGDIQHTRGHDDRAAVHYGHALTIARDIGHRAGELNALCGLGDIHRTRNRPHDAAICYQQVLELARDIGNRNYILEALLGLGHTHHAGGRLDRSLRDRHAALELAQSLNQPEDQIRAHDGLARTYHQLGDTTRAHEHWTHALALLREVELAVVEDVTVHDIQNRLATLLPE